MRQVISALYLETGWKKIISFTPDIVIQRNIIVIVAAYKVNTPRRIKSY